MVLKTYFTYFKLSLKATALANGTMLSANGNAVQYLPTAIPTAFGLPKDPKDCKVCR